MVGVATAKTPCGKFFRLKVVELYTYKCIVRTVYVQRKLEAFGSRL